MQVRRKKTSRRSRPVLVGLISLVLMTGAAFGGALLWQNAQETMAGPKTAPAEGTGHSRPSVPQDTVSGGEFAEESSGEETVSISNESSQAEVPTALSFVADLATATEGDANFASSGSDEPEGESTVTGAFSVEWQVPESAARADNRYFDDAIFFGDSISTGITAYNIANNTACVAALGVSPSTILTTPYIPTASGGKITLLEAAKAYGERKKVYVMLGGNGLWQEKDSFIADYQTFIDTLRQEYPGAIIYIQPMTPVTATVQQKYPTVTHQKVLEYNEAIAKLAKDNALPFVNVFEALCGPDGSLPADVSADGLHLSAEYYFKWFDYLKSHTVEASS